MPGGHTQNNCDKYEEAEVYAFFTVGAADPLRMVLLLVLVLRLSDGYQQIKNRCIEL